MKVLQKACGLIFHQNKVLFVRSKNQMLFYTPGGKVEPGETIVEALKRELNEELSIEHFTYQIYDIIYGPAHGRPDTLLELICFKVECDVSKIKIAAEIEELMWFSYKDKDLTTEPGKDLLFQLLQDDLIGFY